jgi:hypothetical protein
MSEYPTLTPQSKQGIIRAYQGIEIPVTGEEQAEVAF